MSFWNLLGMVTQASGVLGQIKLFDDNIANPAIREVAIFLNQYLLPFTIVLAVAGAIMAIVLGAAMVRAEDLQKADKHKRKLVGMIVTIVIVIVLVWLTGWLITSYESIIGFFKQVFDFNIIN